MLAAVPDIDKQLDTVRLLLSMRTRQVEIPPSLRQHLVEVIVQAARLAAQQRIQGDAMGEAVELALDVRGDNLESELRTVTDFDSISPDLAGRLLSKLQHATA